MVLADLTMCTIPIESYFELLIFLQFDGFKTTLLQGFKKVPNSLGPEIKSHFGVSKNEGFCITTRVQVRVLNRINRLLSYYAQREMI